MFRVTLRSATVLVLALVSSFCKPEPKPSPPLEPLRCGDGVIETSVSEACDDGNTVDADGCTSACTIERGWRCDAESPSRCQTVCGDGLRLGAESCDDGNEDGSDGCASCVVRRGYVCDEGSPSACSPACGDGMLLAGERCDDGNRANGDGCDVACQIEAGWSCDPEGRGCVPVCGDGLVVGSENCDDGNQRAGDGCSPRCVVLDQWVPLEISAAAVAPVGASAVWTGDEVLLWGGRDWQPRAFSPAFGRWRRLAESPNLSLENHRSFWTGRELLVLNASGSAAQTAPEGALYDPRTDTWRTLPTEGAPRPAPSMVTAWAEGALIVWSESSTVAWGGVYDAAQDRWRPITTSGAPPPAGGIVRTVWSGSELIVFKALTVGGLVAHAYDPATDRWRTLSVTGAPPVPEIPSSPYYPGGVVRDLVLGAVGTEVLLFVVYETRYYGPYDERYQIVREGGRYDLVADTWSDIVLDAPLQFTSRTPPSSLWTGSELVLWTTEIGSGRRYVPALNLWSPMADNEAPTLTAATSRPVLVVEGNILVHGHSRETSQPGWWRLDRETRLWSAIPDSITDPAPPGNRDTGVVWAGDRLMVVGGGLYPAPPPPYNYMGPAYHVLMPYTWSYAPTSGGWSVHGEGPGGRFNPIVAWTGREVLVWGGRSVIPIWDGQRYDSSTGEWSSISGNGRRAERDVLGVWAGHELIVWSPPGSSRNDPPFAAYDPALDRWRPVSSQEAPDDGLLAAYGAEDESLFLGRQGLSRYAPASDTWRPATHVGGPFPIADGIRPAAAFGGGELLVAVEGRLSRYSPTLDAWSEVTVPEDLRPRLASSRDPIFTGAVWMFFPGEERSTAAMVAAVYDPTQNRWTSTPLEGAPRVDYGRRVVWTGDSVIVFGGQYPGGILRY